VVFATLTVQQQWELHRFYVPSKDLPDELLLEHRHRITTSEPSLPAVASKLFAHLISCMQLAEQTVGPDRTPLALRRALQPYLNWFQHVDERGKVIRVAAMVRPDPRLERIAIAISTLAETSAR
jgi:hypothetical protein